MSLWVVEDTLTELEVGQSYRVLEAKEGVVKKVFIEHETTISGLTSSAVNLGYIPVGVFVVQQSIAFPVNKLGLVYADDLSIIRGYGGFTVQTGSYSVDFSIKQPASVVSSVVLTSGKSYVTLIADTNVKSVFACYDEECSVKFGTGFMNVYPYGYCRECDTYVVLCEFVGIGGVLYGLLLFLHKGYFIGYHVDGSLVFEDSFCFDGLDMGCLSRLKLLRGIDLTRSNAKECEKSWSMF